MIKETDSHTCRKYSQFKAKLCSPDHETAVMTRVVREGFLERALKGQLNKKEMRHLDKASAQVTSAF